jgi:alginate O-acetyltransferase complex protein AlgI
LQIYYDFSGYSDMAIGLGHIFGFKFLENFNYPYIAESIADFWRRWHMSLGSWFRDYLYIPMGGNRVSTPRHVLNLLAVWAATGFWHGADWNFILWGAYFGALLLLEKYTLSPALARAPKALRHVYVVLALFVSWAFFDTTGGFFAAAATLARMCGAGASGFAGREAVYYLRSYAIPFVIGVIGATPWPMRLARKLRQKAALMAALEPATVLALLVSSTACMVDGSFNPFIYFRF